MYSIENKSEESRAIQNNSEKHVPTAQFKDNRSLSAVEVGQNTAQLEKKENLTGMPDNLKEGIESLSGFSMDDVRVHYNSSKPATVQALAYTQGTDIHVAPGQEKHLPHEAWHVAQQMAGRVSPTTNINGLPVNDNEELEHEADVMGEKAVQRRLSSEYEENKKNKKEYDRCRAALLDGLPGKDKSHPFHKGNAQPWKWEWSFDTIGSNYLEACRHLPQSEYDKRQRLVNEKVAQLGKKGTRKSKDAFEEGEGSLWHIHKEGDELDKYHIKFGTGGPFGIYYFVFSLLGNSSALVSTAFVTKIQNSNTGLRNPNGITVDTLRDKDVDTWDKCMRWIDGNKK